LWLIDKTTSEEQADGETWGIVLFGKSLSARRMADSLCVNERTIRRYLAQLEAGRYIRLTKLPTGFIIQVRKSIKWRLRHTKEQRPFSKPYPQRENAIDRLMRFVEAES
jgi:DNA-binding transcriptional regulator YhcF (GntR family)